MTDNLCCNCKWYVGVHGSLGQAECKNKHKMVLWNECCDSLWLIPKRLKVGVKTNADRIRAMTDEQIVKLFTLRDTFYCPTAKGDMEACRGNWSCEDCFLKWLKQEADNA